MDSLIFLERWREVRSEQGVYRSRCLTRQVNAPWIEKAYKILCRRMSSKFRNGTKLELLKRYCRHNQPYHELQGGFVLNESSFQILMLFLLSVCKFSTTFCQKEKLRRLYSSQCSIRQSCFRWAKKLTKRHLWRFLGELSNSAFCLAAQINRTFSVLTCQQREKKQRRSTCAFLYSRRLLALRKVAILLHWGTLKICSIFKERS